MINSVYFFKNITKPPDGSTNHSVAQCRIFPQKLDIEPRGGSIIVTESRGGSEKNQHIIYFGHILLYPEPRSDSVFDTEPRGGSEKLERNVVVCWW